MIENINVYIINLKLLRSYKETSSKKYTFTEAINIKLGLQAVPRSKMDNYVTLRSFLLNCRQLAVDLNVLKHNTPIFHTYMDMHTLVICMNECFYYSFYYVLDFTKISG